MPGRPSVSGRLVGRAAELRMVDGALTALADPGRRSARLIEVTGEPGIGKTTLLTEIAAEATNRKCLVLSARASELECALPFWLIVDALDAYMGSLAVDRVERLGPELGSELGRLFPSLAAYAGSDDPAVQVERFRAHRAVCELLERLAAAQPVVLILDDVHWADSASLELLGALIRRPPEAAVLVVLALRPHQAPARLSAALGYAQRVGTLDRLALQTLSEDEAGELMGAGVSALARRRIFEVSGGNPFYVEQLGRSLARSPGRDGGRDEPADTPPVAAVEDVPHAVASSLYDEFAGLSAGARLFAEGASIAGCPFSLDIAAVAAQMSTDDALDALDELIAADLVRLTVSPQRFRFRHPLVRKAVYSAQSPGRRMAAHERVDRVLAERGLPVSARAPHVEVYARHGDVAGIGLLRTAGDEVLGLAPERAVRWYEACLRLLPPADARSAELLESLARALTATGAFEQARVRLLEALQRAPAECRATRVRIVVGIAVLEHRLGNHEQAHRRLVAAFDDVQDQASPEAALLLTELTQDAFIRTDFASMPGWGTRAFAAATALGDRPLAAAASGLFAFAGAVSGHVPEARQQLAVAADLVDALPDDLLAGRLDAIVHLTAAEASLDRFHDALRHSTRGVALARGSGQGDMYPLMSLARLYALSHVGRLEDARLLGEEVVESAAILGDRQSQAWALGQRAWAAVFAGEAQTALTYGERASRMAERVGDNVVTSFALSTLGWAYLESGQAAKAAEAILRAGGGPDMHLVFAVLQASFHELLTHAWIELGRFDEAEAAADRAEGMAKQLDLQVSWVPAYRARAALALVANDADAAAGHAFAAVRAADGIGAVMERARSRVLAGTALAAAGATDQAGRELDLAIVELDAYGATRPADAARAVLGRTAGRTGHGSAVVRGLGAVPRRRSAELTARENDIAELVVAGKTNRQIAEELFLSLKTVESHLGRIFRKLDVTTRASLVRELMQQR